MRMVGQLIMRNREEAKRENERRKKLGESIILSEKWQYYIEIGRGMLFCLILTKGAIYLFIV